MPQNAGLFSPGTAALRAGGTLLLWVSLLCGQNISEPQRYPQYRQELEQFQTAFLQTKEGDQGEGIARMGVAKAIANRDRDGEAHWLRMLGASFERRGDFKQARPNYEQSLKIRRELSQKQDMLLLTSGIGYVCYRLRDYSAAQSYLTEAVTLAAELGDRAGESRAHLWLSRVNTDSANFPAALREGLACVRIVESMPKRSESDLAAALDVIGTVFHQLEQPRKALDYFRQALEIRTKSTPAALADSYNRIGVELDKLGSHAEAIDYFQKVLASRRQSKDPGPLAGVLINLATAQQGAGNLVEARKNYIEALGLVEKSANFRSQTAIALYGLGNIEITGKRVDAALARHRAGYEIRRELGDELGSLRSLNRIAIALEIGERWNEALEMHRQAMSAFESLLARIADPVQALEFRRTSEILYPHHARVLIALGRKEEALEIAERGRGIGFGRIASLNARTYSDLLGEAQRKALSEATAKLAQARNQFRVAVEQADDGAQRQVEIVYLEADRDLTRVRDGLFASNLHLQKGAQTARSSSFADLTAYARRHPDTLFLEWVAIDDSVVLFALSGPDGLSAYVLPASVTRIAQAVDTWRRTLRGGENARGVKIGGTGAGAIEPEAAKEVYDAILGPAAKLIENSKFSRLKIVAEGPLLEIPFPALVDSRGKRLTESCSISTAVSITSLFSSSSPPPSRLNMFAVGDPMAAGQTRLVVPQLVRFEPLAGAREEALAVAKLIPQSKVAIGPEAAEGFIKREMQRYGILHFATHGIFDAGDPLRSGVLLSPESGASSEDGVLEAWEIASLPLSSRLAVLSACQTAQGRETLGDGLLGLSWAFQAAGCPNVVASLWSVDDAATRILMIEFYKNIRDGRRVDDAMRAAIMSTRQHKSYTSPYYWSAFRVIGPGEAVMSK